MTESIKKLDPDTAIDIAYDIFLEMAGENLDPADILLFNLEFEQRGAVEFVETADDWEQEIGVLIDPEEYAEVWIGLVDDNDEMNDIFAKFLISHRENEREYHIIWKK
ncbi:HI1450 family dsDNA-mimic protein [Avibacterium avium]|uniref:HI1450 family dsDNA-mimic protein n=1 Tax=Avibacterium avium TaxID=751 RepID=UPI003BF8C8BC